MFNLFSRAISKTVFPVGTVKVVVSPEASSKYEIVMLLAAIRIKIQ